MKKHCVKQKEFIWKMRAKRRLKKSGKKPPSQITLFSTKLYAATRRFASGNIYVSAHADYWQ